MLRSTRLNGSISARIAADDQQLSVRLGDTRFVLDAKASHEHGRVRLSRLELAAGEARLTARGELDIAQDMTFSVAGELERFDPSRFARVPAAMLNGTLSANGRLRAAGSGQGRSPVPSSRRSSSCATAGSPASR